MNNIKIQNKAKILTSAGMLIGLSAVLANFKVLGSSAFDSMPAFLAGIIINPVIGGIVGLLGHLFTGLTSSFPLTLPIHLIIALEMMITVYIFSKVYKINKILGIGVAILLNGPISVLITGIAHNVFVGGIPLIGFFSTMVIPLTLAGMINIVIASIIERSAKNVNI
ncbi:MAG: ECF transporter S component [Sarcina sp.]